ncbi:MAG: hypothetical protein RR848_03945 [Oscillospiraceae bacterium]
MRKFLSKIALALVPIVLYAAVFVAFEPNDYFGFKGKDTLLTRIKGYEGAGINSIVLGDSRLAHMDMALAKETAGHEYYNMAFGGASLEESIDLIEYAKSVNPNLKEVVLGISFYTLNASYNTANRIKTIEKQINNPLAYISNLEYNVQTAAALVGVLQGVPTGENARETATWQEKDYMQSGKTLPYRKSLIAYAAILYRACAKEGTLPSAGFYAEDMLKAMDNGTLDCEKLLFEMQSATPESSVFKINQKELDRLISLIADYNKEGIKITVVFPPMDESVRKLVCEPLGIDIAMANALTALHATTATVLDYEWENVPLYDDKMFFDGFHLDEVYGLPTWTKTLFKEAQ